MASFNLNENDYFNYSGNTDTTVTGSLGSDYISVSLNEGANLTVDAGDGDDLVYLNASATYTGGEYIYDYFDYTGHYTPRIYEGGDITVTGGTGNDFICFDPSANITITGSAGMDTFKPLDSNLEQDHRAVITEFTTGANGDNVDLSQIMVTLGFLDNVNAQDAFDQGIFSLV